MNKDNFQQQQVPTPYVTQRELFDELIRSRIIGYITPELCEMFRKISVKYSKHRKFARYYHFADEFESIGLLACCKGFPKFRPYQDAEVVWDGETQIEYDWTVSSNPFAFFTTCIHNDFIQFLKREYKQSNIVNEMRLTHGLDASTGYTEMKMEEARREKEEMVEAAEEFDDMDDIENDYEDTIMSDDRSDIRNESVWEGYSDLHGVKDTSLVPEDNG